MKLTPHNNRRTFKEKNYQLISKTIIIIMVIIIIVRFTELQYLSNTAVI